MTMTSVAARAGRANEDFTGAVPTAAVLIDGAGIAGAESICRHGVAWYASRLAGSPAEPVVSVHHRLGQRVEDAPSDESVSPPQPVGGP
ncbi:MAG: hypothetical protein GEU94_02160 [Micromonosporaceae bacterium]|nr:hypothetical protein [Micromonosporaceae bacterium]